MPAFHAFGMTNSARRSRQSPPVRPCSGSPSAVQINPSPPMSKCSSTRSAASYSAGTRTVTRNQWVLHDGPKTSPTCAGRNSPLTASAKGGRCKSGMDLTARLMFGESLKDASYSIELRLISAHCPGEMKPLSRFSSINRVCCPFGSRSYRGSDDGSLAEGCESPTASCLTPLRKLMASQLNRRCVAPSTNRV